MQRCSICGGVYPADEMSDHGREQLCQSCEMDKYQLRDEDIPY